MRTTILLLGLGLVLTPPALAGERARELEYSRSAGPNMRWFYLGPDHRGGSQPLDGWQRPQYDPRTGAYYNRDGSIAAYPVKVKPHRKEYVYPRPYGRPAMIPSP